MPPNDVDLSGPNSDGLLPGGRRTNDADGSGALRIFIAEDEFLVAVQLEEDLRSAGYLIVGPFTTVALATQASRRKRFDLAILDINLNGEMVYPLADELSARGVPFILLSGYEPTDLPERYRRSPRIAKPYDPAAMIRMIQRTVAAAG